MTSRFRFFFAPFAALTAVVAFACGSGGPGLGGGCTQGDSQSCACTNGDTGAQVCQSDGTFGACSCDSSSTTSGGPSTTSTGSGNSGSCTTVSDCPPAQYAGVSQVECTGGVCTYPGAFCGAGTSVCGTNCVCPANSTNNGQGCVCDDGYMLETCDGTPCSGAGCTTNFKCGSTSSTTSTGSSGGDVCFTSSSDPLCSCATSSNIDSCSINSSYGDPSGPCTQDCCQTDQGGICCDCASSSYLSTLGLDCGSWISQSGGTQVASCQ